MADVQLKKLFVFVPKTAEEKFLETYINAETGAAQTVSGGNPYENKVVFLAGSNRIWAQGTFYGADSADITKLKTDLKNLNDLVGTLGTWGGDATTIGAAIKELKDLVDDAQDAADDAQSAADEAQSTADSAAAAAQAASDKVDTEIAKVKKAFPVITPTSGSGITVAASAPDIDGKVTYTITADQRIWEFMGEVTADDEDKALTAINGKYTTGEGGVGRTDKEKGDVWAVTVGGKTTLRAWDGTKFVTIGAANGVVDVESFNDYGVTLGNVGGIVKLTITPGTVASGNTSLVTGGTVYTAIESAKTEVLDLAYAYAYSEAGKAADAAAESYTGRVYVNGKQVVANADKSKYEATIYAGDIKMSNAADAKFVAEEITALKGISYSVAAKAQNSYLDVTNVGTAYTLGVKADEIYNYIAENLWETVSMS